METQLWSPLEPFSGERFDLLSRRAVSISRVCVQQFKLDKLTPTRKLQGRNAESPNAHEPLASVWGEILADFVAAALHYLNFSSQSKPATRLQKLTCHKTAG